MAQLTGKNNEIEIHRHLVSKSGTHPESHRILTLLDHFRVQGVNGEHDVLVFPVIGPNLYAMSPDVIQQAIKFIMHQVALGTSFLHHCGVVHAGEKPVLLTTQAATQTNVDLHNSNIAFGVPDLDGKSERNVLMALGMPKCVLVFVLDQPHQLEFLPKYLVSPLDLTRCVKEDDLRVKIMDLGEGSSP